VLETERLRLRRFREDDLDTLARWHADPRFMRYLGRPSLTREESAASLRRYDRHWREHGFGLLAVDDRESEALIGRSGVQYHRQWADDPEVGWGLDPDWWGRGLATEAGAACVRWAFDVLGYPRLVSICTPENLPSRRVMEKLGFRLLATTRDEELGITLWIHALTKLPAP
jgi:RimJ/RimL family protein N-acetyltransferase